MIYELSDRLTCLRWSFFEFTMTKICTFFGHRDVDSAIEPFLERAIRQLIEKENVRIFWIGGYGCFDKCAACILRRLKREYPYIRTILIIAYPQQLHKYESILPFDGFDYPPEAESAPYKFAISGRNRYMAKNADFIIAYVDREYGGAYTALKIAQNNNKIIINLAK